MNLGPQPLLIGVVAVVGVLHTLVPDHWLPITVMARQRGWSKSETSRVALQAGTGHVLSTLAIAAVVWIAGATVATRFGAIVDTVSSLALIGFGLWIAVSAWREQRHHEHGHQHGFGLPHHAHEEHKEVHTASAHDHQSRTALMLILGSSPMVEGIPVFFAAGKYGVRTVAVMSAVFAASTIATYVLLCVFSAAALQRLRHGAVERYGEVLSGVAIALVGLVFWSWPVR